MLDLTRDGYIIFFARFVRLFSFGWMTVALFLYLIERAVDPWSIGCMFAGAMFGDLLITFYLTSTSDSYGRKSVLMLGSLSLIGAGLAFAYVSDLRWLFLAAVLGVISPTGGEIGPFLAVEMDSLNECLINREQLTVLLGWYNVCGYIAQSLGALASGFSIFYMYNTFEWSLIDCYRSIMIGYAVCGCAMLMLYVCLSPSIEAPLARAVEAPVHWFNRFHLKRSHSKSSVTKLSFLFVIDAFASGFVMQTLIVYWFHVRWGLDALMLGGMLAGANVLAGVSALAAAPLINTIGAINTMVLTHLPSNICLMAVPFMTTKESAMMMLLARFSLSQMDVPARQAFVATAVEADERSAAGGITNLVRSIGLSVSPIAAGYFLYLAHEWPTNQPPNLANYHTFYFDMPFLIAGGLKCLYDVMLYCSFTSMQAAMRSTQADKFSQYHVAHDEFAESEVELLNGNHSNHRAQVV